MKKLGMKIFAFAMIVFCLIGDCAASILIPTPPDGGKEIAYKNIDRDFLGVSSNSELTVTEPHLEYGIGLTNVASGQLLSAAGPYGWRYMVYQGTNFIGVSELTLQGPNGEVVESKSLQQADQTFNIALGIAQKLPQVEKADYELRYIEIPAMSLSFLWLHGKSDDIIIPLKPTYGLCNPYQVYSNTELIKLLEPEAKRELDQYLKLEEKEKARKF